MTTQSLVVEAQNVDHKKGVFQTEQVFTIVGGHFMHDTFSSFVAPLLPLIQDRLGTTYAATGALTVFLQLPSLLNPLLGYMADKVSVRYFVILAPAVTATLMSLLGFSTGYVMLAILLFACGLSVAAFHAPAPAMLARLAGRRIGTGMSLFMAGGELGRTVGPLVAAAAVSWWGLEGMWRLIGLGWLTSGILFWRLHSVSSRPVLHAVADEGFWQRARPFFAVLGWMLIATAVMQVALTTYLPIFMRDQLNASLWLAAASLSILEGAGVVGALSSGTLSDRLGRPRVLLLLLIAAPIAMVGFLLGPPWLVVPMLLVTGFATLSPTPVMLAMVQDRFPSNRAVANGLFLAVGFVARALGVWLVGGLADSVGLSLAFLFSAVVALLAIPAVFFLPKVKVS